MFPSWSGQGFYESFLFPFPRCSITILLNSETAYHEVCLSSQKCPHTKGFCPKGRKKLLTPTPPVYLGFVLSFSFSLSHCVIRNTKVHSCAWCLDGGFLQLEEGFTSNLTGLKTIVIFLFIFPDASERRHFKTYLGYWTYTKRKEDPHFVCAVHCQVHPLREGHMTPCLDH